MAHRAVSASLRSTSSSPPLLRARRRAAVRARSPLEPPSQLVAAFTVIAGAGAAGAAAGLVAAASVAGDASTLDELVTLAIFLNISFSAAPLLGRAEEAGRAFAALPAWGDDEDEGDEDALSAWGPASLLSFLPFTAWSVWLGLAAVGGGGRGGGEALLGCGEGEAEGASVTRLRYAALALLYAVPVVHSGLEMDGTALLSWLVRASRCLAHRRLTPFFSQACIVHIQLERTAALLPPLPPALPAPKSRKLGTRLSKPKTTTARSKRLRKAADPAEQAAAAGERAGRAAADAASTLMQALPAFGKGLIAGVTGSMSKPTTARRPVGRPRKTAAGREASAPALPGAKEELLEFDRRLARRTTEAAAAAERKE